MAHGPVRQIVETDSVAEDRTTPSAKKRKDMINSLLLLVAVVSMKFDTENGKMRPELHSSRFGPQICSFGQDMLDNLKLMGFKAARTDDWALLNYGERVCDYYHIFPLMHLDAKNPRNYVFGPTDYLLRRAREEAELDIFFRLGTSIEHSGTKVHFNSLIPDDFDKVAEAFTGTIRHYNRGWAGGFRWGIKYWEIWTEPYGRNNMWCLPDGDGENVPGDAVCMNNGKLVLKKSDTNRAAFFVEF